MEDRGSEQACDFPVKTANHSLGAAESGAVDAQGRGVGIVEYSGIDPGLNLLIEVWPKLPEPVKSQIRRLAHNAARAADADLAQ